MAARSRLKSFYFLFSHDCKLPRCGISARHRKFRAIQYGLDYHFKIVPPFCNSPAVMLCTFCEKNDVEMYGFDMQTKACDLVNFYSLEYIRSTSTWYENQTGMLCVRNKDDSK